MVPCHAQTLRIGRQFVPDSVVSWGPCQFPTLGFVVARYMQHTEFEPEDYWTIDVEYRQGTAGHVCGSAVRVHGSNLT